MLVNFLPNPSKQLIVAHLDHCLRKDSYLESELLQKLTTAFKIKLIEKAGPLRFILKLVLKQRRVSFAMHF